MAPPVGTRAGQSPERSRSSLNCENDSPTALFGNRKRRREGVRHSLLLHANIFKRFVNGLRRDLEVGKFLPELRERFSDSPEFLLR